MILVAEQPAFIAPDFIRPSDENFERDVREALDAFSDALQSIQQGGLRAVAAVAGGVFVEGEVLSGEDVQVDHGLGRIPSQVMISSAQDGLAGEILGAPGGVAGGNAALWTVESVFVRASRTAVYQFVVV